MIERPAAMLALYAAQIIADLLLQTHVSWLATIMPKQHVFRGNCRVGFELEHPMPIVLLTFEQRTFGARGRIAEGERLRQRMRFLYNRHAAAFSCWVARSAAR